MKIRPVGAELFHEYGQTGVTKLIVAFRNFSNAPNWGFPLNKVDFVGLTCVT
jgi:hypothetical protein